MSELQQRTPRLLDPGYLAWLRKQPCACGCLRAAPSDAAHIRVGVTGMGRKPNDCCAVPLHHGCHMRQHAYGDERGWWHAHGEKDPLALAASYYRVYRATHPSANPAYVRKTRSIKERKPRDQRVKIRSRNDLRRIR